MALDSLSSIGQLGEHLESRMSVKTGCRNGLITILIRLNDERFILEKQIFDRKSKFIVGTSDPGRAITAEEGDSEEQSFMPKNLQKISVSGSSLYNF